LGRDLVKARQGVDEAIILAKRLQVLSGNELRSAQRALEETAAEAEKAAADKKRREQEQLNQPIQCPEYTYPKEPESFTSDTLKASLVGLNKSYSSGAIVVSSDAGLTVEECANKVLESSSTCGSKVQYMSYSESTGCSFYPGTVKEADFASAQGTHMFKIDKIAPAAIKQTPRLIKEQAYCRNYPQLGTAKSVDACFAATQAASACAKGENTFTWDPANKGWCSCCKAGTKDALRYNVLTRDKECKIYKQTNDRTNDGATVWNGPGFTGKKEVFLVGWYDMRDLRTIGNDKLTGLDVPAHLKVTLYQHHKAQGKK
jgi:hypothetical protein